jgi:FixJ family two-component response regulator
VKVHRHNLMRKMRAASLPELARMADRLNAAGTATQPLHHGS